MSDTTTTLNPGSGGDVMDEELVTQSDGVTQAKAARVVLRGAIQGSVVQPINTDPGPSPYALPTLGTALVDDSQPGGYVPGEVRALSMTADGRLRVAMVQANTSPSYFDEEPSYVASPVYCDLNPWK